MRPQLWAIIIASGTPQLDHDPVNEVVVAPPTSQLAGSAGLAALVHGRRAAQRPVWASPW